MRDIGRAPTRPTPATLAFNYAAKPVPTRDSLQQLFIQIDSDQCSEESRLGSSPWESTHHASDAKQFSILIDHASEMGPPKRNQVKPQHTRAPLVKQRDYLPDLTARPIERQSFELHTHVSFANLVPCTIEVCAGNPRPDAASRAPTSRPEHHRINKDLAAAGDMRKQLGKFVPDRFQAWLCEMEPSEVGSVYSAVIQELSWNERKQLKFRYIQKQNRLAQKTSTQENAQQQPRLNQNAHEQPRVNYTVNLVSDSESYASTPSQESRHSAQAKRKNIKKSPRPKPYRKQAYTRATMQRISIHFEQCYSLVSLSEVDVEQESNPSEASKARLQQQTQATEDNAGPASDRKPTLNSYINEMQALVQNLGQACKAARP